MKGTLKFMAPLLMAGAAAVGIGAAPYAVAESFTVAATSSITQFAPESPGDGTDNGSGCLPDGTCGHGGPLGGAGCNAAGACGSGGPWGGEGCVPGVGCFHWP
jgi:hypothetical protein